MVLAVAHPWASASYLPLFAVSRQFSAATFKLSCRLAVFPLSSFSNLPAASSSDSSTSFSSASRSATPPLPADPLLSRLLSPLGVTPLSSQRILAPRARL